jgi:tetratricopeptide (TPR) repeat protein
VKAVHEQYRSAQSLPLSRDRYMDHTEKIRAIKKAIAEMQKGESYMAKGTYDKAEVHFNNALNQAPLDYAGLVMMAKCQLAQENYDSAKRFAAKAQKVYPNEAQAYHIAGFVKIHEKKFDSAHQDFANYEKLLPGNPNTIFFKGLSLEGMQQIRESAAQYYRYLKIVNQGQKANYAYNRLVKWGYLKQQ